MASVLPVEWVDIGHRLCAILTQEAARYTPEARQPILLDAVVFTRVLDPANGLPGYVGILRNAQAQKCGSLVFNSDGSYYAEFDVLVLHPRKPRWFVEAVVVWGRDGKVTAEPRLLAAV